MNKRIGRWAGFGTLAWLLAFAGPGAAVADSAGPAPVTTPAPPSVVFGPLFEAVQRARLFPDQKTFADAVPRAEPAIVLARYAAEKDQPGFDLARFVDRFFLPPERKAPPPAHGAATVGVLDTIAATWGVLRREPVPPEPFSSLLPLVRPYIVPGGRFSEIYYWDTYFTMLGLEADGRHAMARDLVENQAALIDRFGHMPNGNRTYYLSRSQPPFFSAEVELLARHDGPAVLGRFLPEMRAEYAFWMEGAEALRPGEAHRRAVRLADGTLLNRYWDDRDVPRDESYDQDVETARQAGRPASAVYRDLRAGAESGWDFSSRWLADGRTLRTIRTTAIAPVDLNCLLAHLEQALAAATRAAGDTGEAQRFDEKAAARTAAIRRLMWDEAAGAFTDLQWQDGQQTHVLSAATVYPLFFGLATPEQARASARTVRERLLRPGGLATTLSATGQQWDAPNGWAPLQYLAVEGLERYGETDLARTVATRWMGRVLAGYAAVGTLVEKYDVEAAEARGGSGGEYPLQVGFGWTNGVLLALMKRFPDDARALAHPP